MTCACGQPATMEQPTLFGTTEHYCEECYRRLGEDEDE